MERRVAVHAGPDVQALSGRRARGVWTLAVAVAMIAAAAGSADARPKRRDARTQFDRGVAAYQKGNFEQAAELLGRSFELERDVDTLFAWAQAERKLDRCDKALDLYQKLLTFTLPPANRTAVEQKLAECEAVIAAQTPKPEPTPEPPIPPPAPTEPVAPPATPPPPVVNQRPAPPEVPVETGRRAWYRDPIALGLLGGGLVAGGVGAGFLVSARSAGKDSINAKGSYPDTARFRHTAEQRGLIGGISAGAGVALVGAGVVWIVLHRDSGERRTITGWLAPGGGGLAISGPL
ncbi:MAG: tetratricopeptide repeat protein [Deltaproteobacteria bacterium]|nr:MAG: tetratricopeptide repeat protein [Deltaproteobacteria bacterium]TMQ20664.1 MAG: tetratricopeptide repeat protein [Deltaproteobacteria bacterium]